MDGKFNSYGTHDWIADSAVRLLMLNEDYREYVSRWLFKSHLNDYAANDAPFKDWVAGKRTRQYYRFFNNEQKSPFLPMTDETWLKARRYVYFLHGTRYPDWAGKKDFNNMGHIRAEYVTTHQAEWIGSIRSGRHSVYFEYVKLSEYQGEDVGFFNAYHSKAADYALQAAGDAIYYLTYEKTEGGITIRGKYEAGALCLGGMAHFIGEVAHPAHVTDYNLPDGQGQGFNQFTGKSPHIPWDRYVDQYTHFSSTSFTNGGPDWSTINPQELASLIRPLNPWMATWMMAEMTYLAYLADGYATDGVLDPISHPNAAPNLKQNPAGDATSPSDPTSEARSKYLAKWAAFYTACAILWVSKRSNIPEDTISDRTWLETYPKEKRLTAPSKSPVPVEKIQEKPMWQKEQALSEHYGWEQGENMSMMLAIGVLAPVLSLSVVPVLFVWTFKKKEQ